MTQQKKTLDQFRVWVEQRAKWDGDCLIWKGSMSRSGTGVPQGHIDGRSRSVRYSFAELLGLNLKNRKYAIPTCGNPRCVAEAHIKAMTASEAITFHWRVTGRRSTDKSISALRRLNKSRRKINESDVLKMRALSRGGMTAAEISRQHFPELSRKYVSDICRGRRWAKVDNPWHQLMQFAANADQLRKRA